MRLTFTEREQIRQAFGEKPNVSYIAKVFRLSSSDVKSIVDGYDDGMTYKEHLEAEKKRKLNKHAVR